MIINVYCSHLSKKYINVVKTSYFNKQVKVIFLQEEVVTVTLNKYRKTHQLLEECERGEHSGPGPTLAGGAGARTSQRNSMSVVREVTRVVRV